MGFADNFIKKNRIEEDKEILTDQPAPAPLQTQSRDLQSVAVCSPKNIDEVQGVIDYLRNGEPVFIRLFDLPSYQDAQRFLDFISGATYALGGAAKKVADNIYLITPEGVNIVGNQK